MQDLTLIQEDDAVHLQSPEPRLRSASSGLVENIVHPGRDILMLQARQNSLHCHIP